MLLALYVTILRWEVGAQSLSLRHVAKLNDAWFCFFPFVGKLMSALRVDAFYN